MSRGSLGTLDRSSEFRASPTLRHTRDYVAHSGKQLVWGGNYRDLAQGHPDIIAMRGDNPTSNSLVARQPSLLPERCWLDSGHKPLGTPMNLGFLPRGWRVMCCLTLIFSVPVWRVAQSSSLAPSEFGRLDRCDLSSAGSGPMAACGLCLCGR